MTEPETQIVEQVRIEDKLHTPAEVAAIFQVDVQTVRIWLRLGVSSKGKKGLVGVKVNRGWRVSKQALQDFAINQYG